jgi:GNAT superfamily N-acetyltransferase
MSSRTDTEGDADSGLEWFSALEAPLSLGANAGERVEALEADMLEDPLEIEVYCDRPPSMTESEVQTVLFDLLSADTTSDNPRYCKLQGSTLEEPSTSSVAESGSGGLAGLSRVSEVNYRLVVTESETPVGFCTVTLLFEGTASGIIPADVPVCIEIGEVWLSPSYRGTGIGRMLADRVVHLLVQALLEIDTRLASGGADSVPLDIEVGADVFSTSGAHFVKMVGRLARDQLKTPLGVYFGEFACIEPEDISAYPRF